MTVYKVVRVRRKSKKGRQTLQTPYTNHPIYLNNKITATGPKRARLTEWRYLWFCKLFSMYRITCYNSHAHEADIVYTVEAGYIHCCPNIESAEKWTKRNSTLFPHHRWAIIECTVPYGTLYFENYDKTQICVRTLIPRKIVSHG